MTFLYAAGCFIPQQGKDSMKTEKEIQDELRKMMDTDSENLAIVRMLTYAKDMSAEFRKEHKDIITNGVEVDLKFTEKMLKISVASLNRAGNEMTDLMMNNINEMAKKPAYQSIEASKVLLSAEAGNGVILKFPSADKAKALTIWHPKDYVGPTQDQTGIILRFYPDWKFHVREVDPMTGRETNISNRFDINADGFLELVKDSNRIYGYGELADELNPGLKMPSPHCGGMKL
jgi:hypothetical protein